jgi:hypothetical protein
MARPVTVQPGVYRQLADIFKGEPLFRAILGKIQTDLNIVLSTYFTHYQSNRAAGSPNCFYFERSYSLDLYSLRFRQLRFVVRDADPSMLEVIWVVVVA